MQVLLYDQIQKSNGGTKCRHYSLEKIKRYVAALRTATYLLGFGIKPLLGLVFNPQMATLS
jgi:hypothetical protein